MRVSCLAVVWLIACNVNTSGSFGVETTDTETTSTTASSQTLSSTDPGPTTTETTTTTTASTTDAPTGTGSSSGTDSATDSATGPTTGSTSGSTGGTGTTGSPADCDPLLYQVVMAVQGNDSNAEWIQIVNPCDDAIDLSAYSLGWGAGGYTDGGLNLSGNLAAGSCHVVGGPTSDGSNGNPTIAQSIDLDPNLGDGDYGVGIFDGGAGAITPASVPVDAVIYGTTNQGHMDPDGNTPAPYVGAAAQGSALVRVDETVNWTVAATNPGGCPSF
jgi:hypothetical protein